MFDPVTRAKRRLKKEEQKELDSHFSDLDAGSFSTPSKGLRRGAVVGTSLVAGLYGLNKLRDHLNKTSSFDSSDENIDLTDFEERVNQAVLSKIGEVNQEENFVQTFPEAEDRLMKLAQAAAINTAAISTGTSPKPAVLPANPSVYLRISNLFKVNPVTPEQRAQKSGIDPNGLH